jgi:hypothetical protein
MLAQMCVKPTKIERLGLTQPPRPPTRGREATELDQARLVRVQLQGELREPLTKLGEEPLRILLILETDDEVVREPHDDHITARTAASPPVDPQIEDVVEVDVREQR